MADARFFSGWVLAWEGLEGTIDVSSGPGLRPRDELLIEVGLDSKRAMFAAKVMSTSDRQVQIRAQQAPLLISTTEDSRELTEKLWCLFVWSDQQIVAEIMDISDRGMGLHSASPVPRGANLIVSVTDLREIASLEAEVRYCVPDRRVRGRFRIGLQMVASTGSLKGRWLRAKTRAA